jgi:hypothetical protein
MAIEPSLIPASMAAKAFFTLTCIFSVVVR